MSENANFHTFWGKAQPDSESQATSEWHPIVYHLLDVAATANEILNVRPLTRERGARLLGMKAEPSHGFLVALVALHDIGKFARSFQAKQPELWPSVLGPYAPASKRPHTIDGYLLWQRHLKEMLSPLLWPGGEDVLSALAPAIFGHHGQPVFDDGLTPGSIYGAAEIHAAKTCSVDLIRLLLPSPIDSTSINRRQASMASWWVSGLVTTADWVGSHQHWFPYERYDRYTTEEYWTQARQRAEHAVREAGLVAPRVAARRSFHDINGSDWTPTPVQRWAASVELPPGPVLIIIEDVTGAGKTEAAQMIVHRRMADGRASGVYWAMPTQATANAMYDRNRESIESLFLPEAGRRLSLVLTHGQAKLNERFMATVLGSAAGEPTTNGAGDDEELPSNIACAAFLADDRRAGMLADVGVGTVDQAMLGALPSRFNTMRLFGLSDKVIVFDEVHAYDPYMQAEVAALLAFQAALGGSAVVLSATLSGKQREKLIRAWTEAVNGRKPAGGPMFSRPTASSTNEVPARMRAYPLATLVSGGSDGVREFPLACASWSAREVPVRLVSDEEQVLAAIQVAEERGAACACVRNTVDDCIAAAELLRARGIEPLVFHARFAQVDRQAREATIRECFGKSSTGAIRRKVLVATQVIEQSLDLDFDMMVSDVAPIDLLIQRVGRLWRHPNRERPVGLACELVVFAPPFEVAPEKDWLKSFLPGTNAVYRDVGVIWRTVRALMNSGVIITPGSAGEAGGIRSLVESVYDDEADIPPNLERDVAKATGQALAASATAIQTTLKVDGGYHGGGQAWVRDMRIRTRLGEEPTVIRLAAVSGDGELRPWADDGKMSERRAWALSEVKISGRRVPFDAAVAAEFADRARSVRAAWGRFEQNVVLLPLIEDGAEGWSAELVKCGGDIIPVRYSRVHGLLVARA